MQAVDWIALVGAVMLLSAYVANQWGWLAAEDARYALLNLLGAAALAWAALLIPNWGFLLVDGTWAALSALALVRTLRGRPPAAS